MPPAPPEKLVIIDGHSLLYRAFYALPPLQNRRGEHTNAVYGFTTMLLRLLDEEDPACVVVAFDPPRPSFRVRIDPAYKAQREKPPPELAEQLERTRQLLAALRIPVFTVEDYEADDVIGTLADRFAGQDRLVMVVSGDADLLQLVSDEVTVVLTRQGITRMERYDRALLAERLGLEPGQVVDYKALKGDASDNIPGVPGIGEKTARSLLKSYGSIEGIYANLETIRPSTARNLEENRDRLYTGRKLVSLCRDVPLEADWEDCRRRKPDLTSLLELLGQLEFKSLAKKFMGPAAASPDSASACAAAQELAGITELQDFLDATGEGESLALTCAPGSARTAWNRPVKILALAAAGQACYLSLYQRADEEGRIWSAIAAAGKRRPLVVHDAKLWHHLFYGRDLEAPGFAFDTHLAAYLADPARGGYDLPSLLHYHLGVDLPPGPEKGGENEETPGPLLAARAAQLFDLRDSLLEQLRDQDLEELLFELELPLAAVLARIEQRGIVVDRAYLRQLCAEIRDRLAGLEKKIHALAGGPFNLNSPRQLSEVLFDRLQLPEIRKTKTGRSTDARVLEELALHHEIAALLLHYRQLAKLEGTYLSGLIELVEPGEEKIYTTLNQTATATGRLSSSDPNLQNIPVRLEEGRRIRRAFRPSTAGRVFFAADYSQVELRVLAHLSADPILVEAFKTGQDIHSRTAAEVNGISLEEVTSRMRDQAKAVNFGIIYGSSDYGLAQGLKISRAEAKAYIDSYFERYRGVRSYMDRVIKEAAGCGYVTTILKRRRYLPEITSANRNTRSFAERMALNTPIQGSAADIIKLAMLRIERLIEDGGYPARLILQIHDELLFEIEREALGDFASLVRREMEGAFTLDVPLQVDLKSGCNWEEMEKF